MSKQLLLVAGSGRSGTSLFANIVGNLGFHVPNPRVPTDGSNPRGFGEPQWVVDKHNVLLRQANVHASDARPDAWANTAKLCLDEKVSTDVRQWLKQQFEVHERLVIKDPRLLWFLPLWHRVGNELDANVHAVTMLRHPAEVVSSKLHWYPKMNLVDANRVAGWANTMLFTERATRDYSRVFVRFEDLLDDWTRTIAHASAQLDIPSLVNARASEQASAAELIDTSLRRSSTSWDSLDAPKELVRLCEQVWGELLLLAEPEAGAGKAEVSRLDAYREEYISFYQHAENVAQSTTMAATRPLRQNNSYSPPAAQRNQQPESTSQVSPETSEQTVPASLSRARRLIPSGVRDLMPIRVKRALFDLFG